MRWWPYPNDVAAPAAAASLVLDRNGNELAAFAAPDGQWRFPLGEDEINPHLANAIVAVEDARFFDHAGVDWRAAAAAAWQNVSALRVRRGASTLTMQLHRLREPRPRSLWAKLEQAVRASQVDRAESKREILIEYLNRAPFGGNLVGAGAASWRYFGKPCASLSLGECALLAGLPKNPNRYRPDRFPDRAARRRGEVLDRMVACGMISPAQAAEARAEPVRADWRPLPQHRDDGPLADGALATLVALSRESSGVASGVMRTSIDANVQRQAAKLAGAHLAGLAPSGVSAAAVVVLDTATAECLAAVSLGPGAAGQIDLTRRPRSTGSVLKPLIYAAAFEVGTCTPATVLDDSPAAWPGYAPQDYDRTFRGQMTAADALADSRNIPAMLVLSRTGVEHTLGVMRAAGLETLGRSASAYGLSLAVGGAEATPMEVAVAYAGLARGGTTALPSLSPIRREGGTGEFQDFQISDLRSLSPSPRSTGEREPERFLAQRACWQTLRALSEPDRTAAVCREAAALNVAWKTGTSSGNRDAWCAAVTPRRTVVVWLGNPSGDGAAALVGRDAAAPLALELVAAIETAPADWPAVSEQAVTVARPPPRPRLAIVSPAPGREILLSDDVPAERQRVALQTAGGTAGNGRVHWFLNGQHLGVSASANSPFWWSPTPGTRELRAVNSAGQAATCRVHVIGRAPTR